MRASRAGVTVLLTCALLLGAARADDAHKAPAEDPDPGFLEFLGGVDGLAETNPDYLAPGNAPRLPTPPGSKPQTPAPPPAPAGARNHE